MKDRLTGNTRITVYKRLFRHDIIATEVEYRPDGWTDSYDGSYHESRSSYWRLATPQDIIDLIAINIANLPLNVVTK